MRCIYPVESYNSDEGGVLPQMQAAAVTSSTAVQSCDSVFADKNATMPDGVRLPSDLFANERPAMVTDDHCLGAVLDNPTSLGASLVGESVMRANVGTELQDQFVPRYMSRAFPWALTYMRGGPEYPSLFQHENLPESQRWRRVEGLLLWHHGGPPRT